MFSQILINDCGAIFASQNNDVDLGGRLPDVDHPHLLRGRRERHLPLLRHGHLRPRYFMALRGRSCLDC